MTILFGALALTIAVPAAAQTAPDAAHQVMDHSKMDHSKMNHSKTDGGKMDCCKKPMADCCCKDKAATKPAAAPEAEGHAH